MKFDDLELQYKGKTYTIPSNSALKLFRTVSCMVKIEYMANAGNVLADEPWLFSDAYLKALTFSDCDLKDEDSDTVLVWMQSDNDNKAEVLRVLTEIKQLLDPPKKIQEKLPEPKKKKAAARKK